MNILLLSDTHDEFELVRDRWNTLNPEFNFDLILHCGDYADDGIEIGAEFNCEVVCVKGNCDGSTREDIKVIDTPAGKIMITHGHMENVEYGLMNLFYRAKELDCVCACFGHTHIPYNQVVEDVRLINPGSLSKPRGGSEPSCATMEVTEGGIDVKFW